MLILPELNRPASLLGQASQSWVGVDAERLIDGFEKGAIGDAVRVEHAIFDVESVCVEVGSCLEQLAIGEAHREWHVVGQDTVRGHLDFAADQMFDAEVARGRSGHKRG